MRLFVPYSWCWAKPCSVKASWAGKWESLLYSKRHTRRQYLTLNPDKQKFRDLQQWLFGTHTFTYLLNVWCSPPKQHKDKMLKTIIPFICNTFPEQQRLQLLLPYLIGLHRGGLQGGKVNIGFVFPWMHESCTWNFNIDQNICQVPHSPSEALQGNIYHQSDAQGKKYFPLLDFTGRCVLFF